MPASQQLYLVNHPMWPAASHGTDWSQPLSQHEAFPKPGSWGIGSHSGVPSALHLSVHALVGQGKPHPAALETEAKWRPQSYVSALSLHGKDLDGAQLRVLKGLVQAVHVLPTPGPQTQSLLMARKHILHFATTCDHTCQLQETHQNNSALPGIRRYQGAGRLKRQPDKLLDPHVLVSWGLLRDMLLWLGKWLPAST